MKKYLVIALCLFISGCWETEKGEKVGNIVKIGKQGFFIKTIEAELIRGNLNSGSGAFGKPFDFTIEDEKQALIAEKALNEQKSVKIKYHKEWLTFFRTETEDNSFLDDIEIIK